MGGAGQAPLCFMKPQQVSFSLMYCFQITAIKVVQPTLEVICCVHWLFLLPPHGHQVSYCRSKCELRTLFWTASVSLSISSVEHDFRLQEGQVVRTWKVGDPPEGSPQTPTPQPTTPHQQDSPQPVRPPATTKKNRKKCFWFLWTPRGWRHFYTIMHWVTILKKTKKNKEKKITCRDLFKGTNVKWMGGLKCKCTTVGGERATKVTI